MPITPYLSLDFCQSITFPLSAFIILSLLPKNSMAGQSLSLQRPILAIYAETRAKVPI